MPSPLVDTHCHIGFEAFDEDRAAVLSRAREAGVVGCVVVAVDVPSARNAQALAAHSDGFAVATAGLHPNDPSTADEAAWQDVVELIDSGDFVALGETGLDLYRDHVEHGVQRRSLRRHIELSLERRLPLVIHCRDAFDELAEVLGDYRGAPVRGVLHCFTGKPADMPAVLEAGLHVGVGGIATFGKSDELRAALREVPDDRLLVETDAPFLAPVPRRGHRNEPAFVAHTADYLAKQRGMSSESLAIITTRNAEQLFGVRFPRD